MRVAITQAKGQLTELVRRAEAGEEVVLTRHGQPAVKLVPAAAKPTREERAAALDRIWKAAAKRKKDGGPSAARSQDYLYDEYGLPK
ncbi:MAG: type II toxin-antitoxin system prevent-host-death family antitoxin [Alphaproteobacteria bacterium]|nr:type II toxin-antitoxin system prevent-host-death family antitoxin [Alphaproteobacteria bacterium]